MESRNNPPHSHSRSAASTRAGVKRTGSLIIEAVISVALLATATYALTRLARSSADLNQQSNQRLAATLTAENVMERLRGVSPDQLAQQASAIANSVSQASGCAVEITSEPFSIQDRGGIHIRVDVMPSSTARITLHDWRMETPDGEGTTKNGGDDA